MQRNEWVREKARVQNTVERIARQSRVGLDNNARTAMDQQIH